MADLTKPAPSVGHLERLDEGVLPVVVEEGVDDVLGNLLAAGKRDDVPFDTEALP